MVSALDSWASNSNGSNNTNVGFSWEGGADWVAQTSTTTTVLSGAKGAPELDQHPEIATWDNWATAYARR